jgi:hypothetical protein
MKKRKQEKKERREKEERTLKTHPFSSNGEREIWREKERKAGFQRRQTQRNPSKNLEIEWAWKRQSPNEFAGYEEVRKRREIQLEWKGIGSDQDENRRWNGKKERKKGIHGLRKQRKGKREKSLEEKESRNQKKGRETSEWKEDVVRVGTGYRVRRDEKDPRKRRFDVGYSDRKEYKRKEGREVKVEKSNIGRTLVGKGKDARVRVINAVCAREKLRPASEYTGSGIRRKSRVGKRKLKPTKAQTK